MAGLMSFISKPEFGMWLSNVGGGAGAFALRSIPTGSSLVTPRMSTRCKRPSS